ncbi:MAG TPA: cell division protein ZapA [Stellaceae bacterium]|nr:cell division protein ZapA [Stellaceae bacterium]
MPQVTVTVNGNPYAVQCDPGEENRIRDLARVLDSKIAPFAQQPARVGETRLLVLAALVLADELAEANDAVKRLSTRVAGADDPALADGIDRLTRRIEEVASRLESAHM